MRAPRSFTASQWRILALLFFIAVINYFDRQSLSVIAPRVQAELHLSDAGYAHIVSMFLFASAIAYGISGFITDALGARWAVTLFVGWWSLAEAATSFATSTFSLAIARFFLGLGEPGLWVAAPKAVSERFERRDHNLAVGLYTLGATAGAVIALPVITLITTHLPWRSIFLLDGAVGLLWLPLWLLMYRGTTRPTAPTSSSSIAPILREPATWKLLLARSLTDPVWYFLLFWFPKYLHTARQLPMSAVAHIGWLVYLGAGIGTVLGGVAARRMIEQGRTSNAAYQRIMLTVALALPFAPLVAFVPSAALAVAIASILALAHMAWLVTLTATIVGLYPGNQVGRVTGLVAMGSGFGGMLSSEAVGMLVTHHGYAPVFCLMALLHPIAYLLLRGVYQHPAAQPSTAPAVLEF